MFDFFKKNKLKVISFVFLVLLLPCLFFIKPSAFSYDFTSYQTNNLMMFSNIQIARFNSLSENFFIVDKNDYSACGVSYSLDDYSFTYDGSVSDNSFLPYVYIDFGDLVSRGLKFSYITYIQFYCDSLIDDFSPYSYIGLFTADLTINDYNRLSFSSAHNGPRDHFFFCSPLVDSVHTYLIVPLFSKTFSSSFVLKNVCVSNSSGCWNDSYQISDGVTSFIPNNGASYDIGYSVGYQNGVRESNSSYYDSGYNDGVNERNNYYSNIVATYESQITSLQKQIDELTNGTVSLSSMFWSIGNVPITIMKGMLSIDLLGFNLFGLVSGLLTALLFIWLIKLFIRK